MEQRGMNERNEPDPTRPHHFQIRGHIIRRGPGRGMHYNNKCPLCDKYSEDSIHDYEDPRFAAAEAQMRSMAAASQ